MNASTKPDSSRSVIVAGLVIIVIGAAALVSELLPNLDRYIPLVIGLVLLIIFAFTRSYGALVGGSIMTGLGTGLLLAQAFPSDAADGVGAVLGLGIGFISIWLISEVMRLRQNHWWPLIPGSILTIVGVGLAADAFTNVSEIVVSIVVLAVGVVVMAAGLLTSRHGPQGGAA